MNITPKPASTVVLMDDDKRIYLTKRPATMKFMGGYHVFPGGSVEKADELMDIEYIKTNNQQNSIDFAYYIAAARELYEEVGIFLAKTNDGSPIKIAKEQQRTYRRQLQNGEITFNQLFAKERLQFQSDWLTYFGQIITPSISKIRFDTRFFLAKLPDGQTPEADLFEIDEAHWFTAEDALDAYEKKEIMLAPPTILTLKTLIDFHNGGALMLSVTEHDLLELLKQQANS
ncbi:NUDIX hydrolase [Bacillus sp. B15-48]|uniref:NUDIX hydrolase n=1 Tax=Bacillus sp. B15-48 TaxID=1548601 RepID=UPI00193F832B|nr:NUDIX hydrolase [Bacillus sp. B15-48]MBM4763548.1 NUDIX domain-containing protein [Bacillus sp. B15-48]